MTDVLTWTVQQRLELEERAELLRTELAGISSARPGRSSEITTARAHRRPYRPLSGRRSRTVLGRWSLTRT